MSQLTNRMYRFVKEPEGVPDDSCFQWDEQPVPELEEGQILVRNQYLSLDPSIRTQMTPGPNYLPTILLGEVMRGVTLGEVVATRNTDFREGDLVTGMHGWEGYTVTDGESLGSSVVPRVEGVPLTAYLSIFGPVGITAYIGMMDVAPRLDKGKTLLVSAAAGSVGSAVGQIGKILGYEVVGTAGTDAKCTWLTEDCGFDAAINYKTHDGELTSAINAVCPDGVDLYFDNVGGAMLDAALANANPFSSVVCCGSIAGYNDDKPSPPVHNLWMIVVNRIRMRGFLFTDHAGEIPKAIEQLGEWVKDGKIVYREDVMQGLENAPAAMRKLFNGQNQGKMIVAVDAE